VVWKSIKVHDEYHKLARQMAAAQGMSMSKLTERLLYAAAYGGILEKVFGEAVSDSEVKGNKRPD